MFTVEEFSKIYDEIKELPDVQRLYEIAKVQKVGAKAENKAIVAKINEKYPGYFYAFWDFVEFLTYPKEEFISQRTCKKCGLNITDGTSQGYTKRCQACGNESLRFTVHPDENGNLRKVDYVRPVKEKKIKEPKPKIEKPDYEYKKPTEPIDFSQLVKSNHNSPIFQEVPGYSKEESFWKNRVFKNERLNLGKIDWKFLKERGEDEKWKES